MVATCKDDSLDPPALRDPHCAEWQRARPYRGEQTGVMDRDRDTAGVARNARARDALGRPLPHGVDGVPRQQEGIVRTSDQTIVQAQMLLDAGRPFHAHEVFEDAWKNSRNLGHLDDAALWKALAQFAVGCTHRARGNQVGALRLLQRAADGLADFSGTAAHDIDVQALRNWALAPDAAPMPLLRIPA